MNYLNQIATAENLLADARTELNDAINQAHYNGSLAINLAARTIRSLKGTYREDEAARLDEHIRLVTAAGANLDATTSNDPAVLRQLAHSLDLLKMTIATLDRLTNETIAA